jgi:hypothetical protein
MPELIAFLFALLILGAGVRYSMLAEAGAVVAVVLSPVPFIHDKFGPWGFRGKVLWWQSDSGDYRGVAVWHWRRMDKFIEQHRAHHQFRNGATTILAVAGGLVWAFGGRV